MSMHSDTHSRNVSAHSESAPRVVSADHARPRDLFLVVAGLAVAAGAIILGGAAVEHLNAGVPAGIVAVALVCALVLLLLNLAREEG